MSSNLSGVVLSAPSVDPNIDEGQSFTMTIYGTYSGGGGASAHDMYLEWDQGIDSWQAIPSSGALNSAQQTSYVGTMTLWDSGNPISITVNGDTAGTYKIRAHGYRGSDFFDPAASPWFTVTVNAAGGPLAINVNDRLGKSEALD
ncbi:MAG: hypothetical protein ACWGNO_04560 [Desulfobacterales bacterium]